MTNIKKTCGAAAAIALLILLPLLIFACKEGNITPEETTNIPVEPPPTVTSLSIIWDGSAVDLLDAASYPAPESDTHIISVENGNDEEVTLTFYFESEISCDNSEFLTSDKTLKLTVAAGERKDFSLTAASNPMLVHVADGGFEGACIYTESGLMTAVKGDFTTGLVICADMTVGHDLTIGRPCTLETWDFSLDIGGKLLFLTDDGGTFTIKENRQGRILCTKFFAEATECDIVLPESFDEVLEAPSYYCRAKSVNGVAIPAGERKIISETMVKDLMDPEAYPTLKMGDTVIFSGDYTVTDTLVFDLPVSFVFENGVTFRYSVIVRTDKEGTINISSGDSSVKLPRYPVLPDAPRCDIVWSECRLSMLDICSAMRIRSMNGQVLEDFILGGDGKAELLSVTLSKSQNRNLTENITWTLEGYVFRATVSCVVDPKTLKNAKLTLGTKGDTDVSFHSSVLTKDGDIDLLNDMGAYCTLTDSEGNITRYAIITEYIPTKLPVITIDTKGGKDITSKEEYIDATISINCDYVDGFTSLNSTSVQIRGRGNSTWEWDKKPYKLKFDTKTSVLNMAKAKKWTLLANYADKSLIRNSLAMYAASRLNNMPFAPTQHPVDVFLNGKYIGVYSIGEQIEVKEGRVELTDNPGELDTGYLLEVGGTSSEDTWDVTCFYTELMKYVKVVSPEGEDLSPEQVAFIKDFVTKADEAIIAGKGYEEYVDVDALIDWYIIHELSYNLDSSFRRSCFLTKDAGGKLKMGPVWDFDLAFGNFSRDPAEPYGWACLNMKDDYLWTNWMSYLMKNEAFVQKLKSRWDEVKDTLLSDMMVYIDEMYSLVSPSAKYNFEVWDILNKRVGFEPKTVTKYNTYELQIQFLKDFINKRWNWMNENMVVVTD